MRKIYSIIVLMAILCFCTSCEEDEATITVINKIPNVRLDKVSYGDIPVASYLIPGDKGSVTIDEGMRGVSFPMKEQIRFYMTRGDNKVLLYTKEYFVVGKEDKIEIILTGDTEVFNPLNQ